MRNPFRERWEVVYFTRPGLTGLLPEREHRRTRHWFWLTARLWAANWESIIMVPGVAVLCIQRAEIRRLPR